MIAVIDYKAGNLTSVGLAFETLGIDVTITDSPELILNADKVIFPGVGAAGSAMKSLNELGLIDVIRTVVERETPFLGICLGTQIIFDTLEENGGVTGIGIIPGSVPRFQPSSKSDKVPQMGWNAVKQTSEHPIFTDIEDNSEFYFVHSYYPAPSDESMIIGTTDYADITFASAITKGSLVATQFHPEKSGKVGLKLLQNFVNWNPKH
ncbi:MAG: imidazole glycerol phosphate synthase subunit HisH [Kiritimatiellae bacterium]|nr:imidazole glycerol phosphate synthase subunit HisH [Kiritimatiellia bacterium]